MKNLNNGLRITHPTQKEWDKTTERIKKGVEDGTIYTAKGGFADWYFKCFAETFKECCNKNNIEPLITLYRISIDGYKENFPELDEADLINSLKEQIENITSIKNISLSNLKYKTIGRKFIEFLENRIIKTETKADTPTKKEYNSSQFNENTYKLFCHIVDEYKKDGNIKFINIWYFLKRDIDKVKYGNILFNFTQKTYKEFVKRYDIEIKKFEKAEFKYKDDEVGILQNITDTYYKRLKQIETT